MSFSKAQQKLKLLNCLKVVQPLILETGLLKVCLFQGLLCTQMKQRRALNIYLKSVQIFYSVLIEKIQ